MTNLKLLILSKYASSKEVGFETRLFALSRIFVQKGHFVTIVSSDSNHFGSFPSFPKVFNYDCCDGINIVWIKTLKYFKTTSIRRILSWIDFELKLLFFSLKQREIPDVIIVSSLSLLTILNGIRLKQKYKCKLIFEIRDIWPLVLVEEGGFSPNNLFVRILAAVERVGYKRADLIVGTMPNLKAHVREVVGKDLNCICMPFGYDPLNYEVIGYNVEDISSTNNYNIDSTKFIVGYAGSIGISNGLDTFIDCIISMNNNTNFQFIILGDGAKREEYMEKTKQCSNVVFIPKVKRNEVASVLKYCDLLYFSALKCKVWDYGWSPNKLIDYMMSGKPVIASYSGYRSMIDEAESGFFVPAEDVTALKDELQRIQRMPKEVLHLMGASGKKWLMANRKWEVIADNYIQAIKSIL